MKTNLSTGLNNKEVEYSRKTYGSNTLEKRKSNTIIKLFVEALGDPIIKILIIALFIKLIFLFKDNNYYETFGILIAVLIAAFISSISEYGSEKAFKRLEEENSKVLSKVKRNSNISLISMDEIVVGDIIYLKSGDKIPADGKIIEGNMIVDESSLTGESKKVNKKIYSKVFKGTIVEEYEGVIIVTEVGSNTVYGSIASELLEKAPDSPLKIKLRELARIISFIGYIGAFLVSFSYLFKVIIINNNFNLNEIIIFISNKKMLFETVLHALTLAVTIIVVAVPEGLPMMITLVLSSNMKSMLKSNVLIRKINGIETAGSLNILFTDKTGTLTTGEMEMKGLVLGNGNVLNKEKIINNNLIIDSLVYNNECLINNNKEIIGGNSTDRAIIKYCKDFIYDNYKIINKVTFNSKNKYSMITINKNKKTTYIKGASEYLIKYIKYYYNEYGKKEKIINVNELKRIIKVYSKEGIRIVLDAEVINDREFILIGFILLKDEIRKETFECIKLVRDTGINTIMLTGDSKDTAINIGKEIGLLYSDNDICINSSELNNYSDEEIKKILPNLKIVSRCLPSDKSRLIKISQDLDLVVGMTGDGVNDAPALKKSDVGFAMGSGTEVSKESSDIIILDNNFLSIVKSILYGRTIFKSIRKFIVFQLTVNFLAISLSIICPFFGIENPVTIMQMLWINMIMDTLAALAFSFEKPRIEYMTELPKSRNENILNSYMKNEIVVGGLFSVSICFFFLTSEIIKNIYYNNAKLMTAFFGLFIFLAIFNLFNVRTHRINILSNLIRNKVFIFIIIIISTIQVYLLYNGGSLFRTSLLSFKELIIMLLLSFSIIPFDIVRKIILKKKNKNTGV